MLYDNLCIYATSYSGEWRESVPKTAIIPLPFTLTRTVELTCLVIFFKGCCREDRERLQCSMTVSYIAMDFIWNGRKSHVGFTFAEHFFLH